MRRVNEALHQVLAEAIEGLADPRLGFVTLTAVRATSDFKYADVYVSVLGSERRRAQSLEALSRAHGVLQREISRQLRLKRTPQLTFKYDETTDRALRMSQLLDEAPTPSEPPVAASPRPETAP
jgi:ribosome-binding factor A